MKHGTATEDDFRYINALREENKRLAKTVQKIDLQTPFEIWMSRLGWALLIAVGGFIALFIFPSLNFDDKVMIVSIVIGGGTMGWLVRNSTLGTNIPVRRLAFFGPCFSQV